MRGLIFLLATAVTCRAGYVGSSPYGSNPLVHHPQVQQIAPSYAPPAPVGQDGNVIDTPEVARAKAAHFAEFARAAARAAEDEKHQQQQQQQQQISGYSPQYSYPTAVQPSAVPYLRQTNYQQPTPIYQTANHVPASVYNPVDYQQHQPYDARANFVGRKSYALPAKTTTTTFVPAPLAEDGTVVDTPEVAALKAARLAELAEAEARAYKHASTQQYDPDGDQGQVYSASPVGPAPVNYNPGLGHLGASRAYPGPSYHGTQPYAAGGAPQTAFGKPYDSSSVYQPQQYQPQHLIGAY